MLIYPTAIGSEPDHPDFDTQPLWERVIVANGIANGTFMVAVNRTGEEPPLRFYGSSFISDPYGRVLVQAPRDEPAVLVADLDLDQRGDWLELFPFLTTRRPDAYASLVEGGADGDLDDLPQVRRRDAHPRAQRRDDRAVPQMPRHLPRPRRVRAAADPRNLLPRQRRTLSARRAVPRAAADVAALIEFPADDPERALRFWRGLLEIDLAERGEGEGSGWVADSDGVRVGVHERGRGPGDTASLPYFPVADMTSALRKVEDLGGSIVHPGERWSICRDSEGTPFALEAR